MPSAVLEIRDFSKYFAEFCVLHGISLTINRREIFGLLGPNGAGKTTLIKCILQLLKAGEGKILYQGKPLTCQDIHNKCGYLPEDFIPPRELNAKEFLKILDLSLHISSCAINSLFPDAL